MHPADECTAPRRGARTDADGPRRAWSDLRRRTRRGREDAGMASATTCNRRSPTASRPDRRHRRVRDARRRREGQGAQGRRPPGHRIRRRRSRTSPSRRRIVAAAQAACADPRNHRYSPAAGLPELREAIADEDRPRLRAEVSAASQVLITNGGKQAVVPGVRDAARPRRRGAAPAPYWTTYPEAITLAGGVPVVVRRDRRRLPALGRPARGRPYRARRGAAVVLAVQPAARSRPAS